MIKQDFISVYFTSQSLQIVELNKRSRKVGRYATIKLPEGIIKNNIVQDLHGLSLILKGACEKLRITEKGVSLVIPEFATFTKLLKLPKIPITDIDEAVNWQLAEFLPMKLQDSVVDWKIVTRSNENYQILAVAVSKEILDSFVAPCEMAGLFPLAVETPSLALLRIAKQSSGGKLVIYKDLPESVLVMVDGDKIVGSSVLFDAENEEILTTSVGISKHFQDIVLETVYVGGVGVNEDLIKSLNSKLGKKVEILTPAVSGMEESDMQKYLISISSQLQTPYEPANTETINLLPPSLVNKYKLSKVRQQVWGLSLLATLFVWFSFFTVFGTYLFLSQQINEYKTANLEKDTNIKQREEITQKTKEINAISEKIEKIKNIYMPPQVILDEIKLSKPQGVNLTDYEFDLDNGRIVVRGFAVDRLSLVAFKQNLEKNKDNSAVEIPISNFEAESNLEFSLSYTYLPLSPKAGERAINR
jgi:hypothetical protein